MEDFEDLEDDLELLEEDDFGDLDVSPAFEDDLEDFEESPDLDDELFESFPELLADESFEPPELLSLDEDLDLESFEEVFFVDFVELELS